MAQSAQGAGMSGERRGGGDVSARSITLRRVKVMDIPLIMKTVDDEGEDMGNLILNGWEDRR